MTESNDLPLPSRSTAGWLGLLLRAAATIGLMAWLVNGMDWGQLWTILVNADRRWWLAAMAVTLTGQVVAGIRWAALARPLGFDFSRRFFVRRFFEGMFFSLCLPSSIGGDIVKAVRIGASRPLRLLAACSVFADRLTGLAALGVLVGTATLTRNYALSLGGAAAVFTILLAAVLVAFWLVLATLDRLHALLPAGSLADDVLGRLSPYRRRPSLLFAAVGWSFVVQLAGVVVVGLLGRAVGVVQPPLVWMTVVPLVALAMVLPISIGGFGVRENALEFLLRGYDVPSETGIAIALLWGACTVLAGLIGGILFLLEREPLGVGDVAPLAGQR